MTLLFFVNFVVFKKQFWKWQFSVKSETAPTISLFKNTSVRSFKNQKQISGIWIFEFFSFCMIMYMLISQTRSENPRIIIFYKHGSRKYRRTLASKLKTFLTLVIYNTYCFFQTIARQRKFSMYWKSFLRSERLGQALFLPSLRATSILSGSLVAAISLSQQKCLFCSRIWITLDNFSTAVVPSAVPHMFWMAYR